MKFKWYKADFNGASGIIDFLKSYDLIPKNANPKIEYSAYNWKYKLNHFSFSEENKDKPKI